MREQFSEDKGTNRSHFLEKSGNFISNNKVELTEWASPVFVVCVVASIFMLAGIRYHTWFLTNSFIEQQEELAEIKGNEIHVVTDEKEENPEEEDKTGFTLNTVFNEDGSIDLLASHVQTMPQAPLKGDMGDVYGENADTIGWLSIAGTVIDYPVMQTPDDEEFYLNRDFNRNSSSSGCLIMDTDSQVGSGTKANNYADGSIPCTNLIVHGHHMKNGSMFGDLDLYKDQSYEKKHSRIKLSTLYEDREYEIISVFLSQVYLQSQTDVFKYYKFFQADTQEQFDDFYNNIKKLALYDTGVTAQFGDEFISLSVCAYHVENGRLVVVGKRVK